MLFLYLKLKFQVLINKTVSINLEENIKRFSSVWFFLLHIHIWYILNYVNTYFEFLVKTLWNLTK